MVQEGTHHDLGKCRNEGIFNDTLVKLSDFLDVDQVYVDVKSA